MTTDYGRCASRRSAALRAEPVALSQAKPAAAIADAVFEDLIADFTIEEGREPDLIELAYFARVVRRFDFAEAV
jgi:hypothetical protein